VNPHADDPRVKEWIDRARDMPLLDGAEKAGARLKRAGAEWVGPCAYCGGTDRFSVNPKKGVWNCRGSEGGSSVIDLVMHLQGCSFIEAVEFITGEDRPASAKPETPEQREEREMEQARRRAANERRQRERELEAEEDAERAMEEVERLRDARLVIFGTHAEAYLKARGISLSNSISADLGFIPALAYWGYADGATEHLTRLATLPAMVAMIRDSSGRIIGAHRTFLDPDAPTKWKPPNPEIGRPRNGAKKMLGQKLGGLIRLGIVTETLACGEGLESTLSWFGLARGGDEVSIAAAGDLGNISGKSTGTHEHPKGLLNKAGKPIMISNGIPDPDGPGFILPDGVKRLILLGDGDSEAYSTAAKLLCGGRRFAARGVEVFYDNAPGPCAGWPKGADWNGVARRLAMLEAA
jgi:hypothetical protein